MVYHFWEFGKFPAAPPRMLVDHSQTLAIMLKDSLSSFTDENKINEDNLLCIPEACINSSKEISVLETR